MSYPDPRPPPNYFMPQPNYSGGYWPPYGMENEQPDFIENHPTFKRPRNSENPPNFTPANNPRVNPLVNGPGGSRGTGHIFYKTRICMKFTEGTCWNGETCSFAHGVEDLREPPPNWQDLIRENKDGGNSGITNIGDNNDRMIRRMKICKKYYNGEECPYGDKCNFLHERPPPAKFKFDMPNYQRESSAISIGTTGDASYQSKAVFWKTRLCSKWEIGQCPFGDKCHYAHGVAELRVAADARVEEVVIKPSLVPAAKTVSYSPAAPANLVIGATTSNAAADEKALRWKPNRKINRIYGDWLDDLSPTKEEEI